MAKEVNVNEVRHPEWPEGYQTWMTLVEAADVLDVKYPGYVRTLCVSKGDKPARIKAVKLEYGSRERWACDPASVVHYRDNRGSFGQSSGGGTKRRAIVRFHVDQIGMEQIEEALREEFGDAIINVTKPYQYKPKNKKGEVEEDTPEWHVSHVNDLIPEDELDVDVDDEGDVIDDGLNL